jgi:hypothetical protein
MQNPKLLCAIGHGLYKPWIDILYNGQAKTWLSGEIPEDMTILHFHGRKLGTFGLFMDRRHEAIRWTNKYFSFPLSLVDGFLGYPFKNFVPSYFPSNELKTKHLAIKINFPDAYVTVRWKILGLFEYFLNETSCNYLMLTTSSSYINTRILENFVNSLPENGVYVGSLSYPGARFVSGSNRILSRDVVEVLYENRMSWKIGTIEDLELGRLIKLHLNINATTVPIVNIESLEQLENLDPKILYSNYHFRLKSGTLKNRNDVQIMEALHKKLLNIGGGK